MTVSWAEKFAGKGEDRATLRTFVIQGENRVLRRNKWDLGYEWWLEWGDNTDEVVLHREEKESFVFL